jgi:hypothetical protein
MIVGGGGVQSGIANCEENDMCLEEKDVMMKE